MKTPLTYFALGIALTLGIVFLTSAGTSTNSEGSYQLSMTTDYIAVLDTKTGVVTVKPAMLGKIDFK